MLKKVLATVCLFILVLGIVFHFSYKGIISRPLVSDKSGVVTIEANGETFYSVMHNNEDSFKSLFFLKIYNKLNKVSINVIKGVYEFPGDINLAELLSALEDGKYNTSIKKVTIPEGYTIKQIAKVLESNNIIDSEDFIEACENYPLPDYIKRDRRRNYALEGYLFPDTYFFREGISGENIISVMLNRFEAILKEVENETGIKIKEDEIDDVVNKASIIEKEVKLDSEKSMVSSVIDNRINKKMPLQIDATVIYALGEHKNSLTISDTKVQSLYNTYYVSGLPVGPISNPGKESIKAAISPEESDYIYYMTKDGVNHKFFVEYSDFIKYKNSN